MGRGASAVQARMQPKLIRDKRVVDFCRVICGLLSLNCPSVLLSRSLRLQTTPTLRSQTTPTQSLLPRRLSMTLTTSPARVGAAATALWGLLLPPTSFRRARR